MQNDKFVPSVRNINGIQIYFKSKTVVQVTNRFTSLSVIRWDKPGGGTYYKSWRPFCSKLCHLNNITSIYEITTLANKYGLTVVKTRHVDQPPPDVWQRHSKYIWPKKKGKRYGNFATHKNKR